MHKGEAGFVSDCIEQWCNVAFLGLGLAFVKSSYIIILYFSFLLKRHFLYLINVNEFCDLLAKYRFSDSLKLLF
jgi:hypothetical protein